MLRKIGTVIAGVLACLAAAHAEATTYELPGDSAAAFGSVEHIKAVYEDTLTDLARRYSLGYEEIVRANPGVDPWLPGEGTDIVIPGQRILPADFPREGIVINLPEHRLYYFPPHKKSEPGVVITFPVSIGKMDWRTPIGQTRVVRKQKNPYWYPPASVRKEHAARGDPLPAVVKPGPDNPLGAYALRLAISPGSYLIHGTNNPLAVGMAVTHGCMRLYPEDIEALYKLVPVGTKVWIINRPVKVALVDGELLLEVHPPINAEGETVEPDLEQFSALLDAALGETTTAIHWGFAREALQRADGMPTVVGLEADAPAPELIPASTPSTPVAPAAPPVRSLPAPTVPQADPTETNTQAVRAFPAGEEPAATAVPMNAVAQPRSDQTALAAAGSTR